MIEHELPTAREARSNVRASAKRLPPVCHKGFHTPSVVGTTNDRHGAAVGQRTQEGAGRWNLCEEVRYLHVPPVSVGSRPPCY